VLYFEALIAIEANSELEFAEKKGGFRFAYETYYCFRIRFKNCGAVEFFPG
jgi:hypothetical protein